MRNLFRLAVVLLIVHALYRFGQPYVHYHQFKDAVADAALFARNQPDPALVDRVMELAGRYEIPLAREAVQITRDNRSTFITLEYEEQIEWVPSYTRPMAFRVSVEGWHALPPSRTEGIR